MRKVILSLLVFAMVFTSWAVCFAGSEGVEPKSRSVAFSMEEEDNAFVQREDTPNEISVADDLEVNCDDALNLRASGGLFTTIFWIVGVVILTVVTCALASAIGPEGMMGLTMLFAL